MLLFEFTIGLPDNTPDWLVYVFVYMCLIGVAVMILGLVEFVYRVIFRKFFLKVQMRRLSRTLPPKAPAYKVYSSSAGVWYTLFILLLIPMVAALMLAGKADIVFGVVSLAMIAVLFLVRMMIYGRRRSIVFTESGLSVNRCAVALGKRRRKGLSLNVSWSDIAEVNYLVRHPHLILKTGEHYGLQLLPLSYSLENHRVDYTIQIWMRIKHFAGLYRTLPQ